MAQLTPNSSPCYPRPGVTWAKYFFFNKENAKSLYKIILWEDGKGTIGDKLLFLVNLLGFDKSGGFMPYFISFKMSVFNLIFVKKDRKNLVGVK